MNTSLQRGVYHPSPKTAKSILDGKSEGEAIGSGFQDAKLTEKEPLGRIHWQKNGSREQLIAPFTVTPAGKKLGSCLKYK